MKIAVLPSVKPVQYFLDEKDEMTDLCTENGCITLNGECCSCCPAAKTADR